MFFGRPGISKGVEFLIEAAEEIKKKLPNSKLILILSKDPKNRYIAVKNKINKLGLNDHVKLIDSVDKEVLPEYILAADCVVVPSLAEGFGYAAVQTALLGVPLVATKVGALPELMIKGACFVSPRSSREISECVVKIKENPVKPVLNLKTSQSVEEVYKKIL